MFHDKIIDVLVHINILSRLVIVVGRRWIGSFKEVDHFIIGNTVARGRFHTILIGDLYHIDVIHLMVSLNEIIACTFAQAHQTFVFSIDEVGHWLISLIIDIHRLRQ